MGVIEDFLQREDDVLEARKYRQAVKEFKEIQEILYDIETEDKIKKEDFKNKLAGLGVNIVKRDERKNNEKD